MEHIDNVIQLFRDKAESYGAKDNDYVFRNNTNEAALKEGGAYFGFISPDEENSGPYHDLSLVCFPTENNKNWLLCIGVGSLGYKNDYELASRPGIRRLFSTIINNESYIKSDITDIESNLPKSFTSLPELQDLKKSIATYTKVLPICQVIKDVENSESIFAAFISMYAKIREWPTNNEHRKNLDKAIKAQIHISKVDDVSIIKSLLKERRYIVLEGAPGCGKTYYAKKIAQESSAHIFFTQFHAETTYGDFIYSIKPNTKDEVASFSFVGSEGIFTLALKYALENSNSQTVLIIDEINRANLSNVLGPIFYLLEYKQDIGDVEIEITPELKIKQLPPNFFVIATMNTADRSLAVVDFALRRRFAWYKLKPKLIEIEDKTIKFFKEDFLSFQEIFYMHATDSELNMQPGQGYFLASDDESMLLRIEYELFPLIKEYLMENLLLSAKEEFNDYFLKRIGKALFE